MAAAIINMGIIGLALHQIMAVIIQEKAAGFPPGKNQGGGIIPPGLQKNPSKHTLTSQSNTNDNGKGNGKDNGNGDNGGGSNTNNVASHKTSGKENGNGNGDNGGGSNTNNVASHKNSKDNKITNH